MSQSQKGGGRRSVLFGICFLFRYLSINILVMGKRKSDGDNNSKSFDRDDKHGRVGRLDEQTMGYYRRISDTLEGGFDTDEERGEWRVRYISYYRSYTCLQMARLPSAHFFRGRQTVKDDFRQIFNYLFGW